MLSIDSAMPLLRSYWLLSLTFLFSNLVQAGSIGGSMNGYGMGQILAGIDRSQLSDEQELRLVREIYMRSAHALGGPAMMAMLRQCGPELLDRPVEMPPLDLPDARVVEDFPGKPLGLISAANGKQFVTLTDLGDSYVVVVPFPFDPNERTLQDILSANLDEATRIQELKVLQAKAEGAKHQVSRALEEEIQRIERHLPGHAQKAAPPLASASRSIRKSSPEEAAQRASVKSKMSMETRVRELRAHMAANGGKLPTGGVHYAFFYGRLMKVKNEKSTTETVLSDMPEDIRTQALKQYASLYEKDK
jgi:hypothetical protein